MSHNIDTMAFTGETPWHGLGTVMPADASIDQWIAASGLTWEAKLAPLTMHTDPADGFISPDVKLTNRKALYRSDTGKLFEVVSDKYQPVQPLEIMEFFRDMAAVHNMKIETAGSLREGAIVWALAKNGKTITIKGDDIVRPYLLLSTGYDKTQATHARPTSVRVVCNNTLDMSFARDKRSVKVPHSRTFVADDVKANLGLYAETVATFEEDISKLAETRVTGEQVVALLTDLFGKADKDDATKLTSHSANVIAAVQTAIVTSPGSTLDSSRGTAWGVLNGITNYVDFSARAKNQDRRLASSWFGDGAAIKADAFKSLRELVPVAA